MNELEKHKVNRKLDTKEKIVIKALTEKIVSLESEIKKLKINKYINSLDAEAKSNRIAKELMNIIDELIVSFKEGE